jgi:hypothetical protein
MRFGLLGPADDVAALGRSAEFLLREQRVSRAVYLGTDDALDRVVATWARKLVGDDPGEDALWARGASLALSGAPSELARFVQAQRARLRLKQLEQLPPAGRTIEMIGDRVAVMIHDKTHLDEEDILAAGILVYGKSALPVAKRVNARWFVSPGHVGGNGGSAVIDDEGDEIVLTVFDATGRQAMSEVLTIQRATKIRVQGGP